MSWYQKVISAYPNDVSAYRNMGNALLGLGKADESVAWYQKAVMLNSNDADTYYNLGLAYQGLADGKSFTCFQKALQIAPDNATGYRKSGSTVPGNLFVEHA